MTRAAALFAFAALAVPAAAGDRLPVAPPPREVRPDGSRDPAPAEDPAAIVERIIARAKEAGDKLAAADAGAGTRSTQAGILKDIDALLDPPPPKDGGGSSDKTDPDKNKSQDGKKNDKSDAKPGDNTGAGQKDQKGGMTPGGMEPKGGTGQKDAQTSNRRPRSGAPKDGKEPGGTAQAGKGADKQPSTPKAGTPKDPAGVVAGGVEGKNDHPPPPLASPLPLADAVAKEVWGHLPERLRVQMTQHYREEFMPRYAGLLRQYYSSLSGPPAPPR